MRIFKSCVILLCISIFTIGCVTLNIKQKENYFDKIIPPGTVQINATLYCDKVEVGNLDYLEYMYWVKKIYGHSSKEYNSILPDTTVWEKGDSCLISFIEYYLRHPSNRHFPVVGISQSQAMDYCKWRSDRVFEFILVDNGVIKYNQNQNIDTFFTINKYFSGNYMCITPDSNFMFYPEYSLPDIAERSLILNYDENLNLLKTRKNRDKDTLKDRKNRIYCEIVPCKNDTVFNENPTNNVYGDYKYKSPSGLYYLKGNVSEWSNIDNITFGGGWKNTRNEIQRQDTFYYPNPNVNTGFRCICTWKKW